MYTRSLFVRDRSLGEGRQLCTRGSPLSPPGEAPILLQQSFGASNSDSSDWSMRLPIFSTCSFRPELPWGPGLPGRALSPVASIARHGSSSTYSASLTPALNAITLRLSRQTNPTCGLNGGQGLIGGNRRSPARITKLCCDSIPNLVWHVEVSQEVRDGAKSPQVAHTPKSAIRLNAALQRPYPFSKQRLVWGHVL